MNVTIHPFQNEKESISVGSFTIENRIDSVTMYGHIDLTRDKKGLSDGRVLRDILDRIVKVLEAEPELPDSIPPPKPTKTIKNPFA